MWKSKPQPYSLSLLAGLGSLFFSLADAEVISGETKRWHKVTLSFDGPASSEKADPNPFTDYRLMVTFTHPATGQSRSVPGYFAADGQAAESSAEAGQIWRVHFSPPLAGEWQWQASFRAGEDVALSFDHHAGQAWAPLDGSTGIFTIDESDKSAPDFRARGHLEYVGESYLRFAGDGTRFIKTGVNSPEVMLGYADFDGTYRDTDISRRLPAHMPLIPLPSLPNGLLRFESHRRDWQPGDPMWKNGRGQGLIGGINYLSTQGVNSVYFVTMNVLGDGRNVWPWIAPDQTERFDCSKLDQWEIVFSHLTQRGLKLHLVTQETENDHLLDQGELGRTRQLYYRQLVARFAHHPAITWNLGEENVQTPAQQHAAIAFLRQLLPYRQHIVLHNDHWHAKNLRETFDPHLNTFVSPEKIISSAWDQEKVPALTGTSIQDFFWPDVASHVRHYVQTTRHLKNAWVVTADELGGANDGAHPDATDPAHNDPRRFGLWATLMAGGAGIEWYFGWQNNSPTSDLSCDNWRTREKLYQQSKIARDFFHQYLPFWRMSPMEPEQLIGHGTSGLGLPGEIYALYLPHGGGTRFHLSEAPGLYEIKWFNPRTGGSLIDGPTTTARGPGLASTGFPPSDLSQDWVVLIRRRPETAPLTMQFPGDIWAEAKPEAIGIDPQGLHSALKFWRFNSSDDGAEAMVMARRGVVFYRGPLAETPLPVYSVTQSFTSTALGLLIDEGRVTLETRAARLEPLLAEKYPAVTLRHFATMTSGYSAHGHSRWGEKSTDGSATPFSPSIPLFTPGEKFAHWDEAQMMFGRVLTQAAQQDLFTLLDDRLFRPMGLKSATWIEEGQIPNLPLRNGCTGLQLHALDLARFGHLFLNHGRWHGRQLLSAEWVNAATTAQVASSIPTAATDRQTIVGSGAYGYNWWTNSPTSSGQSLLPDAPPRTYMAVGLHHNYCLIIPEWDIVITRLSRTGGSALKNTAILNRFLQKLSVAVYPLDPLKF